MNWKHTWLAVLALVLACQDQSPPAISPPEETGESDVVYPSQEDVDASIRETIKEIEAVLDLLRGPRGRATAVEWGYDYDRLIEQQEAALAAFKSDLRPWTPADHIQHLKTLIEEAAEAGDTAQVEGLTKVRESIARKQSGGK